MESGQVVRQTLEGSQRVLRDAFIHCLQIYVGLFDDEKTNSVKMSHFTMLEMTLDITGKVKVHSE